MDTYKDCILFLLAKAYQRAYGNFKKRLQKYGLTPVQNLVLLALAEEEGLSAGEIGKRLLLDNATLSGVLDRLAEGGWIIKKVSEEDKRLLQIYLLPKGKNILNALMDERAKANEEILSGLRIEEQLLLKRMLRDLQE